jgi:hypothetical protein
MIPGQSRVRSMFRFKLFALCTCVLFMSTSGLAQDQLVSPGSVKTSNAKSHVTVALSYLSWNEAVSINSASGTSQSTANLFGNALAFDLERYFHVRFAMIYQLSALYGVANIGSGDSAYQLSGLNWWGAGTSVRLGYRLTRRLISSLGPIALFRQLSPPTDSSGSNATSGSSFNYGATLDLRWDLTPRLVVRQEIGTLFVRASTFWQLGVGYKF